MRLRRRSAYFLRRLCRKLLWHPIGAIGVLLLYQPFPEVSALLRPPATLWQPFGLVRSEASHQVRPFASGDAKGRTVGPGCKMMSSNRKPSRAAVWLPWAIWAITCVRPAIHVILRPRHENQAGAFCRSASGGLLQIRDGYLWIGALRGLTRSMELALH